MSDQTGSQPNVLIVVLDAVQADFLSAYGHDRPTSPNVERLLEEDGAVRFENAVSPSGATVDSVGSFMSGLYPIEHRAGNRGELDVAAPTLPEFLSERGYRTGMGTCNPFLTPWFGFHHGVDDFETVTHRFERGMNVREFFTNNRNLSQPRRYLRFLRESLDRNFPSHIGNGLQFKFGLFDEGDDGATNATEWAKEFVAGEQSWFCYLHFTETHMTTRGSLPYEIPDEAVHRFLSDTDPSEFDLADTGPTVDYTDEQLDVHRRLYEGGIHYLDRKIGELRAHLESLGVWDETLLIVTSDHGECVGEGGRLGHGILYEPGVHVPLVVKPAQGGPSVPETHRRARTNVLGLYRTIADRIDEAPDHVRGPNLFGEPPETVMAQNFSSTWEWSRYACEDEPWFAFYRDEMKLLQQGEHVELYDLASDPSEGDDRSERDPDLTEEMTSALASNLAELERADVDGGGLDVDSSTEARLRKLGYID